MDHSFHLSQVMPHGMCLLWNPVLLALAIVTGLGVGVAYLWIPVQLRRLPTGPARPIMVQAAMFVLSCGLGHFLDVWVIWFPWYWLKYAVDLSTLYFSWRCVLFARKRISGYIEILEHPYRYEALMEEIKRIEAKAELR